MVGIGSHTNTSESGRTRILDRPARHCPIKAGPILNASSKLALLYGMPRTTLQEAGSSSPERLTAPGGPFSNVSQNAGASKPQLPGCGAYVLGTSGWLMGISPPPVPAPPPALTPAPLLPQAATKSAHHI